MWRCCLNPKVIGGLVAVGLVAWIAGAGSSTLPVLAVLVCPLSMGAMAWQMRRGGASCATGANTDSSAAGTVDAELRELREEIAIEKARRQLADTPDRPRAS